MKPTRFLIALLVILSSMLAVVVPVRAQPSRPNDVYLVYDTVPNVLLVEVLSTVEKEDGIEVTFTVGNPLISLFLPFQFSGNPAELTLVSDHDGIWHSLGLIPPSSFFEAAFRNPRTLTYRAKFTSVEQTLQIESRVFGVRGLAFNAIQVAANQLTGGAAPSSERLGTILEALQWQEKIVAIGSDLHCLSDNALSLGDAYDCGMLAIELFKDSEEFRDLLVGVLRQLGVEAASRGFVDTVLAGMDFVDKYKNISDTAVVILMDLWAGQNYNRYRFEAVAFASHSSEPADTTPDDDDIIVIPDSHSRDDAGVIITTTVTVPGTEAPLDLIFAIDTTASMWDDIEQVKAQATALVDQIATDVADYRLGLVTYEDHPVPPHGLPGDSPSTVVLPLTTDADAAIAAIQGITLGAGLDFNESVYSGLMAAIGQAWRDGAEKAIILLGDAPPHDPEPFTGYTMDQVLAAAYAVDPANIYPILIGYDADTVAAFTALAEGSSGQVFAAGDATEVVAALLEALEVITEAQTVVTYPPPPPMPLCSDIGGLVNTFVRAGVPDSAAGSASIFCRPLVQNRQYVFTGSAAQIGNQDALNLGIIHAIDVYTVDSAGGTHPFFSAPVDVCLEGRGALYLLGASTSPRMLTPVTTTAVTADGFTCGSIGQPGILMLVEGMGNSAQNPSSVAAECTVTTTHNLNLRSEPNTSSEVLATLKFDTSLAAFEQVPGWFHVQSPMGVGWVSADYVVASAGCAQ